ncbi:MAG: hypothetical protein V4599_05990 [Verrucomicrobiota bacterium]
MKQRYPAFIKMLMLACISLIATLEAAAQEVKTPFFRGVKTEIIIGKPSKTEGGDFDDQLQVLKPRVKFTNMDNLQNYAGHKASLIVIGESTVDRKVFKVLLRHDFGVELPLRQILDEKAPDVKTQYDTTGAKFGFKYDGWILVVKDAQGQLVLAKSSSPSLEKMPTQLDGLKQDGFYTRQLKAVENPGLYRR